MTADRIENPATIAALDDAIIAVAARVVAGTELEPEGVYYLAYAAWCVAAARDNLTAKQTRAPASHEPKLE